MCSAMMHWMAFKLTSFTRVALRVPTPNGLFQKLEVHSKEDFFFWVKILGILTFDSFFEKKKKNYELKDKWEFSLLYINNSKEIGNCLPKALKMLGNSCVIFTLATEKVIFLEFPMNNVGVFCLFVCLFFIFEGVNVFSWMCSSWKSTLLD